MQTYTIGQAAEKTGLTVSTLRYYEKEGLLPFVERTEGDKVVYLTFNDAPSGNTKALLDLLDQLKIKATFFVTAANMDEASCKEMMKSLPV